MIHWTMMIFAKIVALVILNLCFLVRQSTQDVPCVAKAVVNLRVTADQFLVWSPNPEEECIINVYLVYIFAPDQPYEYGFPLNEARLDVSFLEICDEWTFVVLPVAGHTNGAERRLVAQVPLPADTDLTIIKLTFDHSAETDHTHVQWDLNNTKLGNCSLQYRLSIAEFGSPIIEDFYVPRNFLDLFFMSSCLIYQLTVRAINIAEPTVEGPPTAAVFYMPGRTQYPPVLQNVQLGATWANLSLRLESEVRNPCGLKALYIASDMFSNITIDLSQHDRSQPVNVTITDLQPETNYIMYAYVENIYGLSDARTILVETESDTTPKLEPTRTKIKK